MAGLWTGDYSLTRLICTIDLTENITRRFCQKEEEITLHVLCYEDLVRPRFTHIGVENSTSNYTKEPLSNLSGLIKRTKLDKVLCKKNGSHKGSIGDAVRESQQVVIGRKIIYF